MTTVDILYPSSPAMELLKNEGRGHPIESSSYFCKICSKRFVSGRALRGHLRAHVTASMLADTFTETEFQKSKRPRISYDKSMEEKDDEEGLDVNEKNPMISLRRNPKRTWQLADWNGSFLQGQGLDSNPIDSSLNCDLCGKEFSSWKGLFGHMNFHCDTHQDSGDADLEELYKHETRDNEEEGSESNAEIEIDLRSGNSRRFAKWLKGKRFKRPRYALQLNPHEQFDSATTNEEEDMAVCLVMLASGVNTAQNPQFQVGAAEPESGYLKLPNNGSQLPKSIRKKLKYKKIDGDAGLYDENEAKKGRYKCTTCKKVFRSHQALGGHRASHNKVRCCFTQVEYEKERLEEEITDEEVNTGLDSHPPRNFDKPLPKERTKDACAKARNKTRTMEPAAFSGKKSPRGYECSICHRVFASGQALGGHKRCHWGTGASDTITTSCGNKETPAKQQLPDKVELLDLNLLAPSDDDCDSGNFNNLGGNSVDSHGASYAQTHSPPFLLSWLMGNYPTKGLLLYNDDNHSSKDDEADSKVGKDIGTGRGCDPEFPVSGQSWLQL